MLPYLFQFAIISDYPGGMRQNHNFWNQFQNVSLTCIIWSPYTFLRKLGLNMLWRMYKFQVWVPNARSLTSMWKFLHHAYVFPTGSLFDAEKILFWAKLFKWIDVSKDSKDKINLFTNLNRNQKQILLYMQKQQNTGTRIENVLMLSLVTISRENWWIKKLKLSEKKS